MGCDIRKAFDGLLRGALRVEPLIDEIVGFDRAPYAFERQASGAAMKVLVDMRTQT